MDYGFLNWEWFSFSMNGPTSNCITFVPTENALLETPGLLEFITSVYWEKLANDIKKTRIDKYNFKDFTYIDEAFLNSLINN